MVGDRKRIVLTQRKSNVAIKLLDHGVCWKRLQKTKTDYSSKNLPQSVISKDGPFKRADWAVPHLFLSLKRGHFAEKYNTKTTNDKTDK